MGNVLRQRLDRDAGLDAADVGLAQHQLVERNVAGCTQGNLLNSGRHVGILHDGRPGASLRPTTRHGKLPPPSHSTVPPQTPPARFRVRCPIPGANSMTSRAGGLPPFRTRLTGPVRCGGAKRLAFGRAAPDLIRGLTPRGTSRPPPPAGYLNQDDATWWNLAGSHRRGCGWGASPLLRKKRRISRSEAKAIRQPRDRLKRQPQERQHSAAVFGGTRDRLPPARGAVPLASWDRSPSGPKPPLGGFGSREPGPEGGRPTGLS